MVPPFDRFNYSLGGDCEDSLERSFKSPLGVIGLIESHARPLLWPSIGFLLGATFPSFFHYSSTLFMTLFGITAFLLMAFYVFLVHRTERLEKGLCTLKKPIVLVFFLLVGYVLGSLRGCLWDREMAIAQTLVGRYDAIAVEVTSVPQVGLGRAEFSGKIQDVTGAKISDGKIDLKAKVCLYGDPEDLLLEIPEYGQVIVVRGKVSMPQGAGNPGEFDYRRYLMGKGAFLEIKGVLYEDHTVSRDFPARQKRFSVFGWLCTHIDKRIEHCFFDEEKGVVKALFLGNKHDLSSSDSANLRFSGLSRFISIAGFHVTWAALAVESIVKKLTKNTNLPRISAILVAYIWAGLSGFTVGPLRAFICILLKHGAFWTRRKYDTLNAFGICSLVIGFCVPYPLLDVSVQMSFGGMLAGWLVQEYARVISSRLRLGVIREGLLRSGLMGIFLLPILSSSFGDVSLIGFFLGGVWIIFTVSAMVSALPVLCGPLFLSRIFGWLPHLVVRGILWTGQVVAKLPFSAFSFPALGFLQMVSYYGVLLLVLDGLCEGGNRGSEESAYRFGSIGGRFLGYDFYRVGKSSKLLRRTLLLVLAALFFFCTFTQVYRLKPEVVFLSVGQGDAAIIRWRDVVIVVDTGTESSAERVLVPYLKRQGIKEVDLCILSHLDSDHAGGIRLLCSTFDVRRVITCPGSKGEVLDLVANRKSLEVFESETGDVYRIRDVTITVFYPRQSDCLGTFSNEDSLVFAVEFQGFPVRIEFWGDAPGRAVLKALEHMRQASYEAQKGIAHSIASSTISIIKVPHHGSPESLVDGFYERKGVDAERGVAVISVGPNSYGHPSPDVIEAAEKNGFCVMRTDCHGAVTVRVSKGSVSLRHYRAKDANRMGTNLPLLRRSW